MRDVAIPLNALQRQTAALRTAILDAMETVVDGGHYVLGAGVEAFEEAFAAYCGVPHCVGVANGSDALELALKAVGVQAGEQVALTASAAMYATGAALACGAEPVFVDIGSDATLDPDAFADTCARRTLRAVVVTHLYGRLAHMQPIAALCAEHGIALVEDCAQAHGATGPDGRRAGAFGDAAAFSFYPTKNLGALGDAGAVACRDSDVAARLRALRQYGWERKYVNTIPGGRNSRLDELQARILALKLPHLDAWNARRRAIAHRYSTGIRHPDISVPPPPGDGDVAHLYVVRSERRDELREHLAGRGIASDVHYPVPDHRQPCFGGRYDGVALPVSERHARTALTLPCFPELGDDEALEVIATCNSF